MGELLARVFIKNREKYDDPAVRASYGKLCGVVGVVCNVLLFLLKYIAGTLCGSVSITADAVNNLSDASSSVVNLIGFKLASKPADDEHPYGHGRYEYLAALTVAVLVLIIGYETLMSGIGKIIEPSTVEFGALTVCVLLASVIVKLWLMAFNGSIGKKIKSGALTATAQDSRNDVVSTLAVLLAAVISYFSGIELDGYMGVCVALFILYSGFGLVKEAISPLLGNPPDAELVGAIRDEITSCPEAIGMHDLIIHDYGPGRRFASVHVEMSTETPILEAHDSIDNIERDIYAKYGVYTSIHYDPVVTSDEHLSEIKEYINSVIAAMDADISMHDLRIVPGQTHTNVIFDCVLPRASRYTEAELKSFLSEKVGKRFENHNCVITIDRDFTVQEH